MQPEESSYQKRVAILKNRGDLINLDTPFVGHNKPFVSSLVPYIRPFIFNNTPFVRVAGYLRTQLGVTLIELMITLTIFSIIGALAMPSFRQIILNQATTSRANEFLTDLSYARSEALKRGMPVEVCPPNAGQTGCACGGNWAAGRLVGVVNPALPIGTLDVLRVREPLSSIRSLNEPANGYVSVTFFNNGLAQFKFAGCAIDGAAAATAVFGLCHDKDNDAVMDPEVGRDIRMGPTGSIRVSAPATAC